MICDETPIIQSIRDFIADCPFLNEYANLLVDHLEDDIDSYSIEPIPSETVVKKYINGSSLRQYDFHFASMEAYTQEVIDQISNSAFYEHFASWLEACSRSEKLPVLDGERLCTQISALTTGYIAAVDETKARYVIQCRLTYLQY